MNVRSEITTPDGHSYVVSVDHASKPESSTVIISDTEDGDVALPLSVFVHIARLVDASISL